MRISVTEEHITSGYPRQAESCPIALAVKDVTGREVEISGSTCKFTDNNETLTLPQEAVNFYMSFDGETELAPCNHPFCQNFTKVDIAPFEFELDESTEMERVYPDEL